MKEYTMSESNTKKNDESGNSEINILKKSRTETNHKTNTFKLLNFDTIKNKLGNFRRKICLSFFFGFRDKTFNEEYLRLHKLNNTILTPCEVKLNTKYEKGNLRLINNLLTISKYENDSSENTQDTIDAARDEYRVLKQKISAGKNYTVTESEKDGIIYAVTVTEYGK